MTLRLTFSIQCTEAMQRSAVDGGGNSAGNICLSACDL